MSSSSDLFVELHVFSCGHGDTLLLRLPHAARESMWVLVDCNLSARDGTLARFLARVESLGVRHLDYVFLTHPDADHFLGMEVILRHFTTGGRSLGFFADAGPSVQHIVKRVLAGRGARMYERLQEFVTDLAERRLIGVTAIHEQHRMIAPDGFQRQVDLIPLGPATVRKRIIERQGTRKLLQNRDTRVETNKLSIILGLTAKEQDACLNILLAADSDPEGIIAGLEVWAERLREEYTNEPQERSLHFHVIKVPHHGSIHSHTPELPERKDPMADGAIACVSAGTRPNLPHAAVLRDYLSRDWVVLLTAKRRSFAGSPYNFPFTLAGGAVNPHQIDVQCADLFIRWSPAEGLAYSPESQRLGAAELSAYES